MNITVAGTGYVLNYENDRYSSDPFTRFKVEDEGARFEAVDRKQRG